MLIAPDTICAMPESTLQVFAEHGDIRGTLPEDGGDAEKVLREFARLDIGENTLAARL